MKTNSSNSSKPSIEASISFSWALFFLEVIIKSTESKGVDIKSTESKGVELIAKVVNKLSTLRILNNQELYYILHFVLDNRNAQEMVVAFLDSFYCNQWAGLTKNYEEFKNDVIFLSDNTFIGRSFKADKVVYFGVFKNRQKWKYGYEPIDKGDATVYPLMIDNVLRGQWEDGKKQGLFIIVKNDKIISLQSFINDRQCGYKINFSREIQVEDWVNLHTIRIPNVSEAQFQEFMNTSSKKQQMRDGIEDGIAVKYHENGGLKETSFYCCGMKQPDKTCVYISPSVFYKEKDEKKEWYYRKNFSLVFDELQESFDPRYYKEVSVIPLIAEGCNDNCYFNYFKEDLGTILNQSTDLKEDIRNDVCNAYDITNESLQRYDTLCDKYRIEMNDLFVIRENMCVQYGITNEILDKISSFLPLSEDCPPLQLILQNYNFDEEISIQRILNLMQEDGHLRNVRISTMKCKEEEWAINDLTICSLEFINCKIRNCRIQLDAKQRITLSFIKMNFTNLKIKKSEKPGTSLNIIIDGEFLLLILV